jgi:WD40 repeat protein
MISADLLRRKNTTPKSSLNFVLNSNLKVAIGSDSGTVKVYNETSLVLIKTFQAHSGSIFRIKQSPFDNGQYVATCSADKTVKIWNSTKNSWSLTRTYTAHTNQVRSLEFIGSNTMASCGLDLTIRIWTISSRQTINTLNTGSSVYSLKLLTNGIHLAAGLGNGNIRIYNVNTRSLLATLSGHVSLVNDLILINNDLLASSGADFTVRIWNLTTKVHKYILKGHSAAVVGLRQISSDMLACAAADKNITLWNITSGLPLRSLLGHKNYIYWSLDLLSDGKTLVSGSGDKTVKFWNVTSRQVSRTISTGSNIYALTLLDRPSVISKVLFL